MDPFLGEIRMFAGAYAPEYWHLCDGSLIPVVENQALFSLIGTIYGGDGQNNFGLPDLRGRLPIGRGQGPVLTNRVLGQTGGSENVTLAVPEMPSHSHLVSASATVGTTNVPGKTVAWANSGNNKVYAPVNVAFPIDATLNAAALSHTGGNFPHDNMMPSLAINFIICMVGIYPTQA